MQNYKKSGYVVTKTVAAAVASGEAKLHGEQLVVATGKYAANEEGEYIRAGVVTLKKKAALAIAEGVTVYWDNDAKEITTVEADGDCVAGIADVAALGAASEVDVLLNGLPYSFN